MRVKLFLNSNVDVFASAFFLSYWIEPSSFKDEGDKKKY